jgi:hypothetical protein
VHDEAEGFLLVARLDLVENIREPVEGKRYQFLVDRFLFDLLYHLFQCLNAALNLFSSLAQLIRPIFQEKAVILCGHGCPLAHDAFGKLPDLGQFFTPKVVKYSAPELPAIFRVTRLSSSVRSLWR